MERSWTRIFYIVPKIPSTIVYSQLWVTYILFLANMEVWIHFQEWWNVSKIRGQDFLESSFSSPGPTFGSLWPPGFHCYKIAQACLSECSRVNMIGFNLRILTLIILVLLPWLQQNYWGWSQIEWFLSVARCAQQDYPRKVSYWWLKKKKEWIKARFKIKGFFSCFFDLGFMALSRIFTYIVLIVHQRRWVKTGEPGEKSPDHS